MKTNSVEIGAATAAINVQNKCTLPRFAVFVAGGRHSIISFEDFARAEQLAVFFADLTNVRMEVFDSAKEICYFIEPTPFLSALVH